MMFDIFNQNEDYNSSDVGEDNPKIFDSLGLRKWACPGHILVRWDVCPVCPKAEKLASLWRLRDGSSWNENMSLFHVVTGFGLKIWIASIVKNILGNIWPLLV